MIKRSSRLRYSLKSLLVLMTIAGIVAFFFNRYLYYHYLPRELHLGSYHIPTREGDITHPCKFKLYASTNYYDILKERTRARQQAIRHHIISTIQEIPYEEKCDPHLASLRTQINDRISKEVGNFQGSGLINDVIFSEYSFYMGQQNTFSNLSKLRLGLDREPENVLEFSEVDPQNWTTL